MPNPRVGTTNPHPADAVTIPASTRGAFHLPSTVDVTYFFAIFAESAARSRNMKQEKRSLRATTNRNELLVVG